MHRRYIHIRAYKDIATVKYTYLGPAGTFCEQALLTLPGPAVEPEHNRIPATNVDAALQLVRDGEVDAAVVPIENSVEGGVSATLDAIAAGDSLHIVAEAVIPVTFQLAALPGIESLEEIQTISTHGHAWAQCRQWAQTTIPNVDFLPASSTAAGALGLLEENPAYQAAICSPLVAERHNLNVLAEGIEDNHGAVTRFVMVQKPGRIPEATGSDKSTIVVELTHDRPGGLREILDHFATRGVNLTRIESRPTGTGLGQYFFSIDLEGHISEPRVEEVLHGLHRISTYIRYLGSYPSATPVVVNVPPHATPEAYQAADAWLNEILAGNNPA